MASVGIVNADTPKTQDPMNTTNRPKKLYFGVFFDGTGNNMIQKETAEKYREQQRLNEKDKDWDLRLNNKLNKYGANDLPIKSLDKKAAALLSNDEMSDISTRGSGYSNVAILHSVYQAMSESQYKKLRESYDIYRYNIYVEGAGTDAINDGSNLLGSGFGNGDTGVVALVSKAVMMVSNIVKGFKIARPEIHFDVFGFSRGATCARLFAFLVAREGEVLGGESKFKKFQASSLYKNNKLCFLDEDEFSKKSVDFLGIYDTVSSIGITYDNNVKDYGLYSPTLAKVKNTFHLCAVDEFREHFALTDIGKAANTSNAELFIPGCHSDVGGGYMLQNETFSLIYRPNLSEKNRIYTENPQSKSGTTEEISAESLFTLGWVYSKGETFTNYVTGYIDCNREKVLGGYSNIPLRMMVRRAKIKTSFEKFSNFPAGRFDIPKRLSKIGQEMLALANSSSGRKWYYPDGSYSSLQYRILRHTYLHFSSTDTLIDTNELSKTSVVHSPSKKGNTICRIVYSGNPDNSSPKYMCDYN